MPFTIPLTINWFKHRVYALERILYSHSPDHFINKISVLRPVQESNKYIRCPICGYSMAELILSNNWSVKACSATGFKNIIDSHDFACWIDETINKKSFQERVINKCLSIKQN